MKDINGFASKRLLFLSVRTAALWSPIHAPNWKAAADQAANQLAKVQLNNVFFGISPLPATGLLPGREHAARLLLLSNTAISVPWAFPA